MACVEPGNNADLRMYCFPGFIRDIGTVQATLARLPSTDYCKYKNATFNTFDDGQCVCETESQKIVEDVLDMCMDKSECDYTMVYPNSSDCLQPLRPSILVQIRYECSPGMYITD